MLHQTRGAASPPTSRISSNSPRPHRGALQSEAQCVALPMWGYSGETLKGWLARCQQRCSSVALMPQTLR